MRFRFGFNGQENDNEVKGTGNSYNFNARIYDSRLGRMLSLDPAMKKYPSISPYAAFGLNPIMFTDMSGATLQVAGNQTAAIADLYSIIPPESAAFFEVVNSTITTI